MSNLPDDLDAVSNALGFKTQLQQVYIHKFLERDDSGPVVSIAAFDVAKMNRIAATRHPDVDVSTAGVVEKHAAKRQYIDREYAACLTESHLAQPVVVLTLKHPKTGRVYGVVADGNHRLYRAAGLGRDSLPGVTLTLEESESCRLPDEVAYMAAR